MRMRGRGLWLLLGLALGGLLPTADAGTAAVVAPRQPVVASASYEATDAGLSVLAEGGNAFDAAVAVSAVLGLTEPESSGLGGGGFMLLRLAKDGREVFIDARERAPLAATRDMYLDARGEPRRELAVDGALAAAIPGLPAGLVHLAENYGRVPLARSLAPAIRLARDGWRFNRKNAAMMQWRREVMARDAGAAALFLRDGQVPAVGSRMHNPDYADTLQRLADQGAAGFYRGDYAQRLVAGVRAVGGIWSEQDLAEYRVVEREPLRLGHRGFTIVTAPPPSSGGIAIAEALNILEGLEYTGSARVQRAHLLTETMRRVYRDRALYLGDPDFVEVPTAMLVSPLYAAGVRAGIHPQRATPSDLLPGVRHAAERPETTHFSIIDRDGNLAAVTQTINLPFGNAVVVPGSGFLLNNEMDDFSVKPGVPNAFGLVGDAANEIAPGKRPLSSMSPSFLIGEDQVAVIGTPGGSRIISMVLLGLIELMDGGSAQSAAALPRFHHQYLPDELSLEAGAFSADEIAELTARGHAVSLSDSTWGNMQVARWNTRTGAVDGGSDPRWEGVGKAAIGGRGDDSIYR